VVTLEEVAVWVVILLAGMIVLNFLFKVVVFIIAFIWALFFQRQASDIIAHVERNRWNNGGSWGGWG